eukprot:TRINITY_DN189_c0_g1_i3.p2 TRINITY_DN189_c0_g1~~TRINITY_DN189_c0_g1_i3.p2  ORF type:complete len:278 (-),score=27.95 TRINITY_DN189_c0_g1_i3:574-1407(-)
MDKKKIHFECLESKPISEFDCDEVQPEPISPLPLLSKLGKGENRFPFVECPSPSLKCCSHIIVRPLSYHGAILEKIELPELAMETDFTGELCLADEEEQKVLQLDWQLHDVMFSKNLNLKESASKGTCGQDDEYLLEEPDSSIPDEFNKNANDKMNPALSPGASSLTAGNTAPTGSTAEKCLRISLLDFLEPSPFSVFVSQGSPSFVFPLFSPMYSAVSTQSTWEKIRGKQKRGCLSQRKQKKERAPENPKGIFQGIFLRWIPQELCSLRSEKKLLD